MKIVQTIRVKNPLGLHLRPASLIVKILELSKSSVFFTYQKRTVDARSIMSLLTLVAKKDAKITITVEGQDAKGTMQALMEAFQACFGE